MTFEQIFHGMEPADVLKKFYDISLIPRMAGEQKQISDYLVNWAKGIGLTAIQDEYYNVLIVKPATKGYENQDTVILQAHMDMVCEKEPDTIHDFAKDPLQLRCDGTFIKAQGTTLGADDGIGVAMIMALFEDDNASHPRLEGLFTVDEETDMGGAWKFDCNLLQGNIMINLDANAVIVAGAGELEVEMQFKKRVCEIKEGSVIKKIQIGGLMGGHTGMNSMLERGNAIALVNRILLQMEKQMSYQILYIQGGAGMSSAYARNASVVVAFLPTQEEIFEEIIRKQKEIYTEELEIRDPGWTLELFDMDVTQSYTHAFEETTTDTLCTLLQLLPDGIITMNRKRKDCMESTANVGVVETKEDKIYVTVLIRAMMEGRKYYQYDKIMKICKLLSVDTFIARDIPHWENKVSEELLDHVKEVYGDTAIGVVQGTLEAGIFLAHMPTLQIVALGCPYYNAHSPSEYLIIREIREYHEKLKSLLAKM